MAGIKIANSARRQKRKPRSGIAAPKVRNDDGSRQLVFPAPLIPVDVYGAMLLGNWLYVVDTNKVSESYFSVDDEGVFFHDSSITGNDSYYIGQLPEGWGWFHSFIGDHPIGLVGPTAAVEAAKRKESDREDGKREFEIALYGDADRSKFEWVRNLPKYKQRKAVTS